MHSCALISRLQSLKANRLRFCNNSKSSPELGVILYKPVPHSIVRRTAGTIRFEADKRGGPVFKKFFSFPAFFLFWVTTPRPISTTITDNDLFSVKVFNKIKRTRMSRFKSLNVCGFIKSQLHWKFYARVSKKTTN